MSSESVSIGPLTVSFSDDPFCQNMLQTMYGDLAVSSSETDIEIRGHDWRETEVPAKGKIRATDEISIDSKYVFVDEVRSYNFPKSWVIDRIGQRGYAIKIGGWETETLCIDIFYDGTLYESELPHLRRAFKVKNRTFANYRDEFAKHFVYDIFEPLCHAWMLSKGVAFLHAASISVDGEGVVLTGGGGTGKTSATSTLIQNLSNVRFLSDDLVFVTEESDLHPYYKSSVVYAYNTAGGAIPEKNILDGIGDRLQWEWRKHRYGEKGVRRRVPPEDLYEGKVAPQAGHDFRLAIYLIREERKQCSHESISSEELARRSTAVIMSELDWLVEYSSSISSVGSTAIDLQHLIENTKSIYNRCFEHVEPILLRIPMNATPESLANYIEREILNN